MSSTASTRAALVATAARALAALFFLAPPPARAQDFVYRDVHHRPGDLSSFGPDAIERTKGRYLGLGLSTLDDSRTLRADATWESTPSLWLGVSATRPRDHSADATTPPGTASATAAFKIMDRLILAYRYLAIDDQRYHIPGIRIKGEHLELAYHHQRNAGGLDALIHITRSIALTARAARHKTYAAGAQAQLREHTLAIEGRRSEAHNSFAASYDVELFELVSLGVSGTSDHERFARIGVRF